MNFTKNLLELRTECEKDIEHLKEQIDSCDIPELCKVYKDMIQFRRGEILGLEYAMQIVQTTIIGDSGNFATTPREINKKSKEYSEDSFIDRIDYYLHIGYTQKDAVDKALEENRTSIGEEY